MYLNTRKSLITALFVLVLHNQAVVKEKLPLRMKEKRLQIEYELELKVFKLRGRFDIILTN